MILSSTLVTQKSYLLSLYTLTGYQGMKEVKCKLSTQFEIKDLGDLHYILGVSFIQNSSEKSLWIGQPAYTSTVIEKFGLANAKPVNTPTAAGSKLTTATDDDELIDTSLYQSAVGSLQYLSTMLPSSVLNLLRNINYGLL